MKYIALDIGNVLCYANMTNFVKAVSETFNVSMNTASLFLRGFQQIHDLGLTTMERELRLQFNCQSEATLKKLCDMWSGAITPSTYMVGMLHNLHMDNELQIALLSNIGVEHAEMMPTKLDPIYNYSIKHFSCFVGARKPNMLYYQSFLLQHPEFKGCLYVDDLQENLDHSAQFGFKTVKFSLEDTNPSTGIDRIRQLILES